MFDFGFVPCATSFNIEALGATQLSIVKVRVKAAITHHAVFRRFGGTGEAWRDSGVVHSPRVHDHPFGCSP